MTPLLLLAEKVEGLSGPDREVDAEIAAALRVGTEHGWALRYPAWVASKDGRVHLEKNGPSFAAPAFTASVDSAMSLVPDGCLVALVNSTIAKPDKVGRATSMVVKEGASRAADPVEAATLPLALVAASLRARAAMEAGE